MRKKATSKSLHNEVYENLLKYLKSPEYVAKTVAELITHLALEEKALPAFHEAITRLIQEEEIEIRRKKIYLPKPAEDTYQFQGIIHVHPRGFGFMTPEGLQKPMEDIFIPKHLMIGAVDGDKVLVEMQFPVSAKGPEGRVIEIIERNRSELAGTIIEAWQDGRFMAYIPIIGSSKPVVVRPKEGFDPKIGDRFVYTVLVWSDHKQRIACEPKKYLGSIFDPACDISAALEEYQIRHEFPEAAVNEAKSFGKKASSKEISARVDLTEVETFTIDPTTAKDFDDALSLSIDKQGCYHLIVHIADVAHYVKIGSELDKEAKERCNSVYFPGTCIPMLPEELSNNLCSLKEGVIRLTASVFMKFSPQGDLLGHDIKRTAIKSNKRFTYEEAKKLIDSQQKNVHLATLNNMVALCMLLKKKRTERGSVDLALSEVSLKIDENGMPYGFTISEYDITHQLVEEFMLKANEVVAKHLLDQGKSAVFRIHEAPGVNDLDEFYSLSRMLGFTMNSKPDIHDVQKIFEQAKSTPHMHHLAVSFIRSMKLAVYSGDNVGHYGLALEYYCHFTSPIRRYSDLVTQRILFDEAKDEDLKLIANTCSEKERASFRAESSVNQLKKLRLIDLFSREEPNKIYEVFISKVKPHGIYFEVPPIMIEGFIHISQVDTEFLIYDLKNSRLVAQESGKIFAIGDKIMVELENINFITQEIQWRLANKKKKGIKEVRAPNKKRKRKRTR